MGPVTPDREVKTSISLFYRTEQPLELHVDSETSPQRGHALCSGVGNCVPTLVKWREDSILYTVKLRDGTIPYLLYENFRFMGISSTSLLRQAATSISLEIIDTYGPEPRRATSGNLHQWHFHITWGCGEGKCYE